MKLNKSIFPSDTSLWDNYKNVILILSPTNKQHQVNDSGVHNELNDVIGTYSQEDNFDPYVAIEKPFEEIVTYRQLQRSQNSKYLSYNKIGDFPIALTIGNDTCKSGTICNGRLKSGYEYVYVAH